MDNDVRELLRDIAKDIPPQREVPPTLRPRARRRIAATVGMTVVLVLAVALGGLAALRAITEASPLPADPPDKVQLPDDPAAWEQIVLPGGPPGCTDMGCLVRNVAAGDAGLVAVGSHFHFSGGEYFVGWSSPDGLSWHQIEGDQNEGDGLWEAEGLAAAGPGFVAARQVSIFTSTDGVSWDRVQSIPYEPSYYSVAAGGPGVVAVGSNKAWFSSDGLTWEAATVPSTEARTDLTEVAARGDRLVATGWRRINGSRSELIIWVSSDGLSWRDVPIDGDVFSLQCRITDVAGAPAGFVATGWCGGNGHEGDYLVWRSADGVKWSRVGDALDGQTPYFAVSAGLAGFVGTNGQRVWTSVDGESWRQVPTGSAFQGAEALEVIAWGSRLVAVGDTKDGRNVVWISGPQQ